MEKPCQPWAVKLPLGTPGVAAPGKTFELHPLQTTSQRRASYV
jgi:hypothetical protein